MNQNRFDLIAICQEISKKIKFILIFTLCAVIIGLVFSLLQPKQYTAHTTFIVKSPSSMDRNYIFRQGDYQTLEYFATESQIDQVMTMAQSDALVNFLADSFKLRDVYNTKDVDAARKRLKKRFEFTRNDTKSLEIKVTDRSPERAAALTQAAANKVERMYRNFFFQRNRDMVAMLQTRISIINKKLAQLEDSISGIRSHYDIYNALLPTRGTAITTPPSSMVSPDKAVGLELLQNTTALKDKMAADRADYYSLISEYSIGLDKEPINMFYFVEAAAVPDTPSFPKIPLILAICLVGGFLFASLLVLASAGGKRVFADRPDTD